MRQRLDARYRTNLARDAVDASALTDGELETFRSGSELVVALPQAVRFDRVVLQEPIAHGQRIARARIDASIDGAWKPLAEITTVGYKRIIPVAETTTDRVRVTVEDSRAEPLIAEFGLYSSK
jgi:alpha-L-fucosidase